MNGEQQRERATAIMALEGKFKEFTETVEAAYLQEEKERKFDDEAIRQTLREQIAMERLFRVQDADKQRFYVDMENTKIHVRLQKFERMGFFSRLWWILSGEIL